MHDFLIFIFTIPVVKYSEIRKYCMSCILDLVDVIYKYFFFVKECENERSYMHAIYVYFELYMHNLEGEK